MQFMRFELITSMERNAAISLVRDAISKASGWIVNHALFSNAAATINFEMPSDRVARFRDLVEQAGLNLRLQDERQRGPGDDTRGSVAMTFLHQERELKREVPPFG